MEGKIVRWMRFRGFGFIEPEEGDEDVFCHISEIPGYEDPKEGQRVKFDVEQTSKGLKAINIEFLN